MSSSDTSKLTALGQTVREGNRDLETFKAPDGIHKVKFTTDEITALCPLTGQPDWYQLELEYGPNELCLESKSLKLYLLTYRNQGDFCEAVASQMRDHFVVACKPKWLMVTLIAAARGGIDITATAGYEQPK